MLYTLHSEPKLLFLTIIFLKKERYVLTFKYFIDFQIGININEPYDYNFSKLLSCYLTTKMNFTLDSKYVVQNCKKSKFYLYLLTRSWLYYSHKGETIFQFETLNLIFWVQYTAILAVLQLFNKLNFVNVAQAQLCTYLKYIYRENFILARVVQFGWNLKICFQQGVRPKVSWGLGGMYFGYHGDSKTRRGIHFTAELY